MTKKYYTPTIDEFYVNFDFEEYGRSIAFPNETDSPYWFKNVFTKFSSFVMIEEIIKQKTVRVKFLDREDIESLGWVFDNADLINVEQYKINEISLSVFPDYYLIEKYDFENTLFSGKIRNKSELIKIMKQTEIWKIE